MKAPQKPGSLRIPRPPRSFLAHKTKSHPIRTPRQNGCDNEAKRVSSLAFLIISIELVPLQSEWYIFCIDAYQYDAKETRLL
jgi:hypothetical protein